jgi:putative DNA methylase
MTTPIRRKLIEVSIPLEAINKASAREKSIRHGHPSTLHLWWARRPLAACRAVLFAQLVDDPSAWPDRFPTDAAQEVERKRLHGVIERLVPWEASNNDTILQEARHEIARSVAWGRGEEPPLADDGPATLRYLQEKAPPVYDPFSGGGSIPLEAQRLGLRAYGSDLNPVAVLIGKALVEIPPKFAGRPPINPESQARLAQAGAGWTGRGAQGLAEDVRYYGRWMRDEAERRIGHLYPKVRLPDGTEATAIAWLWARTVRSPDPAAKGAMVPLVSSFMLATREGRKAWAEVVIDPDALDGWRFKVQTGALGKEEEERQKRGTRAVGGGSGFTCALTGAVIPNTHVRAEGMGGHLGDRLMAIVCESTRSRAYVSPAGEHESLARSLLHDGRVAEARLGSLAQPVPERLTGGTCFGYGLTTFTSLFTARQLITLSVFSDLVTQARELALADARAASLPDDNTPLHADGIGFVAYADAIATYLGCLVSRTTNYTSTLCVWSSHAKDELAKQVFLRQALAMSWDFAETNPFGNSGGSLTNSIGWLARSIEFLVGYGQGTVSQRDAAANFYPSPVVISTDPPYFDNVGYADLSDFFYVWRNVSTTLIQPGW